MADWELFDGKEIQGPFSEEALIESIRKGLPATVTVRRVGDAEWQSMRSHAPFAHALLSAPPPPAPPIAMLPMIQNVVVKSGGGCGNSCGLLILLAIVIFVVPFCVGGLMK